MQVHTVSGEGWFAASALCECCAHPTWAHGPGSICSECDASDQLGACGLLALYGFDLASLPVAEPMHAPA
jgi:hypothetical protein